MAKQIGGMDYTGKASADLSDKQWFFLYQTSVDEEVAVVSATTQIPIGILRNKPAAAGRGAGVRIFGHSKVICGEDSLAAGSLVGSSARGSAVALTPGTDTTAYVVGVVTKGGDSSEYIEIVLMAGPARAQ